MVLFASILKIFSQSSKSTLQSIISGCLLKYGAVAFTAFCVAIEVLKTSIMTDFKIPSVTNTITKETKTVKIKKPTGLYAVGGLHSDLKLYYGATYVRDKLMIGYKIRLDKQIHSLEVGYKVF